MRKNFIFPMIVVPLLIINTMQAAAASEQLEVAKIQAGMWSYVAFAVSVTFVKIAALVLGYLITKLGYTTMMAGVQGKDSVELEAFGTKLKFKGVTPGLALGLVGVLLMGWAISTKHHFDVKVERAVTKQKAPSANDQENEKQKNGGNQHENERPTSIR